MREPHPSAPTRSITSPSQVPQARRTISLVSRPGTGRPTAVFRRLGVRTQSEIDEERYALKALRGDFTGIERGEGTASLRALEAVRT